MPTPTPVSPQPISPTNPSSGRSTFATSGNFPVSGIGTSGFDGPWSVETQTLNITYCRVPTAHMTSASATLTGFSSTCAVYRTSLAYNVNATYSKVKDYGQYPTSSWEQSQKFEVFPVSADPNGVSYGALNASSLGPQGSIITTRPWGRRQAWVDSIDIEETEAANAWSFAVTSSGFNIYSHSQEDIFGELTKFVIRADERGTPLGGSEREANSMLVGPKYSIFGAYSTSSETMAQMIAFVDSIGDRVKWRWGGDLTVGGFYANPAELTEATTGSASSPKATEFVLNYSSQRHDWSGN